MADRLERGQWGGIQGVGTQLFVDDPAKLSDIVALYIHLFGFPSRHVLTADPHSRLAHIVLVHPGFVLSIEAIIARSAPAAQPKIIISGSIAGSHTLVEYRYGREYLLAELPRCTDGIASTASTDDTINTSATSACMVDIRLAAKELGVAAAGEGSSMHAALKFAGTIIGDSLAVMNPESP